MDTTANVPLLSEIAGYDLGSRTIEYSEADAILYAIAVGAEASELDLVWENRMRVLPTYGLTLGLWAVEAAGELGAYDRMRSLHAAQRLDVHAAMPPSGVVELQGRIGAVWDKGKSAVVDIEVRCPQFTATYSIFLLGAGGWGGERGPAADPSDVAHTWSAEHTTRQDLAALYRLTGDRHPVHIDPEVASAYGFSRPILHGLCTLGIAARMVAGATGAHPCDLTALEARFATPVFPGDTLQISAGTTGNWVHFDARVGDATVLSNGRADFRG